jgi:hypothetical protein
VAIVAAFALIAAAILLVIDDIQTWRKGGDSLFGRWLKWLDTTGAATRKFWLDFRDTAVYVWNLLSSIWSAAWGAIKEEMIAAWPIIKVALIAIGIALAAAIVIAVALLAIVLALLGAIVWLTAKIATITAKVITFIFESPSETIRKLKAWFSKVFSWLGTKWTEISQLFIDGFTQLAGIIGNFFMSIVQWVIDEAIKLFTVGLSSLIETFGGAALNLWSKIKGASNEGAQAGAAQQRAIASSPPPTLAASGPSSATIAALSPQQRAAVTMATSHSNVDAAKTNSDNTSIQATINVRTPEEASQAVMTLKDKAAKKQQTIARNAQQTAY